MSTPGHVTVTGGSGGVVANRDVIEHLAALFRGSAAELHVDALLVAHERDAAGTALFGGDWGDAGSLDAAGLTAAGLRLAAAERGLRAASEHADALGRRLTWAARGYPWGTDALDAGVMDQVRGLLHGVVTAITFGHTSGGDPDAAVAGQEPHTVDGAIGLIGPAQLSELASGGDDGLGVAVPTGRAEVAPPRGLPDLLAGLSEVDHAGTHGGIDVRILTDADGHRRAVVDVTGTRSWGAGGHDPADLATNSAALIGKPTAYAKGVVAALRAAGVTKDEPVMLVGHSQGGLVAVNAARDMARTGEFRVTHVVTAGSPVGITAAQLPASVRLLALENARDVVPRLDGRVNPDRRNVTTVSGRTGDGSVGGNHAIDGAYRPLAEAAVADGNRSVRDFLAGADGWFRAERAEQQSFRVERR